jgi:hypothetical protein
LARIVAQQQRGMVVGASSRRRVVSRNASSCRLAPSSACARTFSAAMREGSCSSTVVATRTASSCDWRLRKVDASSSPAVIA